MHPRLLVAVRSRPSSRPITTLSIFISALSPPALLPHSEIEAFIPGILDGDLTFESYLERMSHPSAWGGESPYLVEVCGGAYWMGTSPFEM